MGYIAATILALVPSPLLEFRYFIIAFYIYRLSLPPGSISSLAYERTLYVLINGLAFGLFFLKPFEWPQNPGEIQRFMW